MLDFDDLKKLVFVAAIMLSAWLMFGRSTKEAISPSEQYVIELNKKALEKVERKDIYIDSLEGQNNIKDVKLKILYNDTLKIHNYYLNNIPTISQRDSLRAIYNPS